MVGRAVGVVLAVICATAVVLGLRSFHQPASPTVAAVTYDSIRVGQTEHEVSLRLPGGSLELRNVGGRPPVGARCWYYRSAKATLVYRFCFSGGKLVEKTPVRSGSHRQQTLLRQLTGQQGGGNLGSAG